MHVAEVTDLTDSKGGFRKSKLGEPGVAVGSNRTHVDADANFQRFAKLVPYKNAPRRRNREVGASHDFGTGNLRHDAVQKCASLPKS